MIPKTFANRCRRVTQDQFSSLCGGAGRRLNAGRAAEERRKRAPQRYPGWDTVGRWRKGGRRLASFAAFELI